MEAAREYQSIGRNVVSTRKYRLLEPSAFATMHSACSLATPSGRVLIFASAKHSGAKPVDVLEKTQAVS